MRAIENIEFCMVASQLSQVVWWILIFWRKARIITNERQGQLSESGPAASSMWPPFFTFPYQPIPHDITAHPL